jgi:ribulose kinase
MCAAVCAGVYADLPEAAAKMVQVAGRTDPNPALTDIYTQKYGDYKRAITALDGYWQ